MFDSAFFSTDFALVDPALVPESLTLASAVVEELTDLADKGQVAAKSILNASDIEQALAERLEQGSVVAHTVVGRAIR